MSHPVSDVIARAAHTVFGRPLLHYDFVTIIVEAIVAECLAPTWRWQHGNGEQGAFLHDGLILKVKHFESLDHHASHAGRVASWIRYGSLFEGAAMVQEDIVVLAHHPLTDPRLADHRDPAQWDFFVLDEATMPIGIIDLREVESLCERLKANQLHAAVARAVATHRARTAANGTNAAPAESGPESLCA